MFTRLRMLPIVAILASSAPLLAGPGYLRHPAIHGDRVVFCAEDDLWVVSADGGTARRLTSHPGVESYPTFSPDGRWIAFTAEYQGNGDVYLVSAEGGEPRRMTWHPGPDQPVSFTPDGKQIVFRSNGEHPMGDFELYTIPVEGGDPVKLPLGWASRLSIEPETGRYAFSRTFNENATWKRYRGGTATDIWVGDPRKADFREVSSSFTGNQSYPMWHGGRVYFVSDQGGTANLWSMRPDGTDRKRHTDFGTWDARFASMAPDGRVVLAVGADVHLYDPKSDTTRKLAIELPTDRVRTRQRYTDPGRYVTEYDLSPDGERVLVVARGEIISVPVKKGVTLPVTLGSGAREHGASFGPEGQRIVYISDATKEEDLRTIDAWGRGDAKVVRPAGETGWHFPPLWSPDGKWIAWSDQTMTLWVAPAEGGAPAQVDRSSRGEIREYTWSPDGRWLAYSKARDNDYQGVFVYDTKAKSSTAVSGPYTQDYSPAWDPEGRYLYFLSDRWTNPLVGWRDFNNVDYRQTKPCAALLRPDVDHPFADLAGLPPKDGDKSADKDKKDDEKKGGDADKGKDKEKGKDEEKDKKKEIKPIEIELEGLARRIVPFPVEVGNFGGLGATAKKVFYLTAPIRGMAEWPGLFQESGPENSLIAFDLEKKKADTFVSGIAGYSIAPGADKIAFSKGPAEIYVVDTGAPPGDKLGESRVALDGMVIELDPLEEWTQIYYQAWREMRDFYWDPQLAGVNWRAVRDQYATLLPRLATRRDLQDLLGELIGEMNTSHTYTWGGDPGVQNQYVPTGLLGADLEREGQAFRVKRIYRGDPADNVRSPLDEPGVEVKEGDYVLAVNQRPFEPNRPYHASLEALAGKRVVLTVNSKNSREGAHDVVVTPLGNERDLRYADWVRVNREYVAQKTGGKIGYVHIPDMWTDGLVRFNTWFYPQLDREGMVIDVRWNGGGAVSQMILERLRRPVLSFGRSRAGVVSTYPDRVLNGPFVVLTNEHAGSDGDIFPMAVQLEKLAPVIGQRSWGGVVGIRGDKQLVDAGLVTQPEFAWWDPKLGWDLENRGVVPDIEVQNLPQDVARGIDTQLDRSIEEVLKLHAAKPPIKPNFGPVRPKSREAYRRELDGAAR